MDRLSLVTPRNDLSPEPTTARPTPRSGVAFKDVVGRGAASLAQEARSMVTRLPGGPVLAAAVRGVPTTLSGPGASPQVGSSSSALNLAPTHGVSTTRPGAVSTPAEGPGAPAGTDPSGAGPGLEGALAQSQDMNLYYLQIQEAMASENRAYSASSNVLKARHDTVKNAIGNIR